MGMGNFSLSWVCLPLDTTDWGEEDPAFWKLPNESSAFLNLLKSHWTKTPNPKRKAYLSFLRWFMVPHAMHWQHFYMYHEGRCALIMFLCVSWGHVCTDNVSVCIMHTDNFLYVSRGKMHTDNVPVCVMRAEEHWQGSCRYHEGRQVHTGNVPVCVMRAGVHWQCFCMYHENRCILTMFLYISFMRAGVYWQCLCRYHEGRCTLTMFLYVP